MATKIEKFEDLIAWQKARHLTRKIYEITNLPAFSRLWFEGPDKKICRLDNVKHCRGFERGRHSEFHQFLSIAKGSCAELRSQLYVALDANYITQPHFTEIMSMAGEVGQVVGGLRVSVEKRKASS